MAWRQLHGGLGLKQTYVVPFCGSWVPFKGSAKSH